jgi:hypothetical protein
MQHPDHINNITTNNGTPPPCQNIMFPIPDQSPLYNYYYYNDNYYQPIINIPTRSTTATLGEVGASVELVRAQLTELSKRMESIEYRFSEFEKCISSDISLLKNTMSEHATELLKLGDKGDKAIELGMIRRRLSKVEDFTSEFYEQFENFKGVKDIISKLSDHLGECDQSISSMIIKKNIENKIGNNYDHDDDDERNGDENVITTSILQQSCLRSTSTVVDLNIYFSEYDDENENEEDDFEKL